MLNLAEGADVVVRIVKKPGQFVLAGDQIALIWPGKSAYSRLPARIGHAFLIGRQRTPTQDIQYAVNQLTEVALRAMSPAINDPFTAMTCLDHIGAGLAFFIEQERAPGAYYDSSGRLRLTFEPVTFTELLSAGFDMLRHASCDNAAVLMKMLDTIETIGREIRQEEQLKELLRHVDLVRAESEAGRLVSADKLAIQERCDALVDLLSSRSGLISEYVIPDR
jgi:uncharacterized membrane protein